MKILLLMLFLVSCVDDRVDVDPIKPTCYVLREGDTNLACKRCNRLPDGNYRVVTLTDYSLVVHPSRVIYNTQEYVDKKLLKPYKGK